MSTDDLSGPVIVNEVVWTPTPPRPKFQHNYARHLIFFGLAFFTTSFTPVWDVFWGALFRGVNPLPLFTWGNFVLGLPYSLTVLFILSAHEFGHYFACRYYNVDATLPYFLPLPLSPSGTLGAVIRIREAFPSKAALFDIGVAGPIAGFVVLVPFLYWGISMSEVGPISNAPGTIYFGEPFLWKIFEWIHFGPIPDGMDVFVHPVGLAAWWGMLATALNLLPFGQLDGGHITYAVFGRRASWLSFATLVTVVSLTMFTVSWTMFAVMMTAMAFFFGFRHPRVADEHEPLDPTRRLVAIWALMIFILCFTPVPLDMIGP